MEIEPQFEEFKNNPSDYSEIVERTSKSICTFSSENTGMATAFFGMLPFSANKRLLHLLIINNIFLREEDTALGKKIRINVNNVKTVIEMDSSR